MRRRTLILTFVSLVAGAMHTPLPAAERPRRIQPLSVGARMPPFLVRSAGYEVISFRPERLAAPTVFVFYRGGWSSECLRHLRQLKEAHAKLRAMGLSVVFLSADAPHNLRSSSEFAALPYELLSDSQMQGARAFGVAYRVDDFTARKYESFGVDLEIVSGEAHHELALPSAFIVDRTGLIRFAHWSPTGIHIKADELVAAARRLRPGDRDSTTTRSATATSDEKDTGKH